MRFTGLDHWEDSCLGEASTKIFCLGPYREPNVIQLCAQCRSRLFSHYKSQTVNVAAVFMFYPTISDQPLHQRARLST